MAGKLTVAGVKALVAKGKPGATADGGGLYLRVTGPGLGKWTLRYMLAGKPREMGLGAAADVTLAEARIKAEAQRPLLRAGTDPLRVRAEAEAAASKEAAAAKSFQDAAEDLHTSKSSQWKNPKHGDQWLATLKAHVFPVFGSVPVAEVETDHVLSALQPIWTKIPETASRVRGRIEAVIDYSAAKGLRPRGLNPAAWRGHLSEVLGAPTKLKAAVRREKDKGENFPSLPWQQVPAFLVELEGHSGLAATALRLAILTGVRSGEVRKMPWRELNDGAAIWTVQAARMKGGKTHHVPLSAEAQAVIEKMKPLADGRDSLVFPGQRKGRPLSDMTISMLVRGMSFDGLPEAEPPRWRDDEGRAVVPHGFRTTFKSWSLAHGWPDYLSEKALAHSDKDKVRAAYARDPLIEERRPMMEAWGRWCMGAPGEVTDLAAERAKRSAVV
jgi:integrase